MRRWLLSLTVGLLAALGHASAQSASGPQAAQGHVLPISLSRPVYPPIAVSARISGDVEVKVGVRPDGSLEWMEIVSGPPLLQKAALDAAEKSRFECRGCSEAATPYSLVFAFQFAERMPPQADTNPPGATTVTPSQSRVTIASEPPVLILHFSYVQVRAAKCLYLWRCGSLWGGYRFYYYPVRSAPCVWLWKCGFRRNGTAP